MRALPRLAAWPRRLGLLTLASALSACSHLAAVPHPPADAPGTDGNGNSARDCERSCYVTTATSPTTRVTLIFSATATSPTSDDADKTLPAICEQLC